MSVHLPLLKQVIQLNSSHLTRILLIAIVVSGLGLFLAGCRSAVPPPTPSYPDADAAVTVKVSLQGTHYIGRTITLHVDDRTYSSSTGVFHLGKVPPGSYSVWASAPPFYAPSQPRQVLVGGEAVTVTLDPLSVDPKIMSSSGNGTMTAPGNTTRHNVLDVMTRLVAAESWGEPYVGQLAVAAVIVNRVTSPSIYFPNTLADVMLQPSQPGSVHYQFEPMSQLFALTDGLPSTVLASARRAVFESLAGKDPTTTQALFFYAHAKVPQTSWIVTEASKYPTEIIGNHTFFRGRVPRQ